MIQTTGPAADVAPGPAAPAPDGPERGRPSWQLALPAIVAAVGVALLGLDRRALWLDESFTLGATNQLAETVRGTSGTMVGYYVVVDLWATVSTSVWWLRLLSVVAAAASLVPLAALARRIGGPALAVRATVVAGLAVQMTRYAQEARSYALVVLLVTSSWWVLVRATEVDDPVRRRRLGQALAVLGVLLPLAHGLAVLNVVALAVAAALAPRRDRAVRAAAPALVASLATVALLLAGGANDVGTWVPALSADQLLDAAGAYTSPWWWVALLLGALVVVGAAASLRGAGDDPTGRWLSALAVVWVAVPLAGLLALSVVRPSFDDRYLIGIVPGLALLLARGTLAVDGRLGRPARTAGVAFLATLVLLVPGQVEVHRDGYDDWRAAARLVAEDARPGDGLAFVHDFHRTPFEAAWREVPSVATAPELVDFERPLGTVRRHDEPRPDEAVADAVAGHDRLWVVVALEPGLHQRPLDELLASDAVAGRLVVADEWRPGGTVRVLLLTAR